MAKFKPGDIVRMIPPDRIGGEYNKPFYKFLYHPESMTIKRSRVSGIDGHAYYDTNERTIGYEEGVLEPA